MSIFLVLLAFGLIALIDLTQLIKKRQYRNLLFFCIIFLGVLLLAILQVIGVEIPSPIQAVANFFKNVLHLSY